MASIACWQLGAIGDVLFFFCSGYTLFLCRERRFDNYYKRRINRIYPTVIMWALLSSAFFNRHSDMINTIVNVGGWFVTCMMFVIILIVAYILRCLARWLSQTFVEGDYEWKIIFKLY